MSGSENQLIHDWIVLSPMPWIWLRKEESVRYCVRAEISLFSSSRGGMTWRSTPRALPSGAVFELFSTHWIAPKVLPSVAASLHDVSFLVMTMLSVISFAVFVPTCLIPIALRMRRSLVVLLASSDFLMFCNFFLSNQSIDPIQKPGKAFDQELIQDTRSESFNLYKSAKVWMIH